jgi:hypothetical protein
MRSTNLIETIFTAVTDINDLDNLSYESKIKHVALAELGLEVGASGKDQSSNIHLVIGNEVLDGQFGNLANIVVTLFISKSRETEC